MTAESVTYDEWASWDDKVWRSRLNTLDYPADYEEEWVESKDLFSPDCYARVEEFAGPHWLPETQQIHYRKLNNYLADGKKWVLVEPFLVADTAGRWIVLGNFLHKTSLYFGTFSIFLCWFYPQKTRLLHFSTAISVLSAFGYWLFAARDPISEYQVEYDVSVLSRFPMKSFYPMKPKVLKNVGSFSRRVSHRLAAGISLVWTVYYLKYPPPFCYCGWDNLERFKPNPI